MKQYPHLLFSDTAPSESTQDGDGNYSAQTLVSSLISVCREETDGRGRQVLGSDGKQHVFTSVIYLPKGAPVISEGTVIYVKNSSTDTTNRIKGPVLKFDPGQLHSRIWV